MATFTRQFDFVTGETARADQWMSEASGMRAWIAANVQDVDGSSAFTAAPVLSGGNPAANLEAVRKAYVDTKFKLADTFSTDLDYPESNGNKHWFFQGGRTSVTTVVYSIETFYVTFPVAYGGSCTPMCWFALKTTAAAAAEIADSYVFERNPTNFGGAIGTAVARTVDIAWLALGFSSLDWESDVDL